MDVNRYCSNSWQSFHSIKKLFRIVEIALILVFLTWAIARLPFAVRMSGEYLRRLADVVVSHLFVFMLSNVLVLILFFKSRHLFTQHGSSDHAVSTETLLGFSQELIFDSGENYKEETVFQDKVTILEVKSTKAYRRSKSEGLGRSLEDSVNDCVKTKLVRLETEKQQRRDGGEEVAEVVDENEMSDEELQRAIEDFIARQAKFHREEKLAIVLHGRT